MLKVGTGFHPDLTVRNIYLNGTILGLTRKDVDSRLRYNKIFGVEKFIDTPVEIFIWNAVRLALQSLLI